MSNIITEKTERLRVHAHIYRLVIVIGGVVILASITGILALLPAYFSLSTEHTNLKAEINVVNDIIANAQNTDTRKEIAQAREELNILAHVLERGGALGEGVDRIISVAPENISIKGFRYVQARAQDTFYVTGSADSRAALQGFVQLLESDSSFSRVSIPVASLAGNEDGVFSIEAVRMNEE